ncbi:myoneurin-like [Rhopalosiphum padi]|uniref:myoneurin-like n=1 Tax=Rhopalosiphum padi TaxID=40932 RepID=UPI00298E4F35|nr:myoneurin-like [Rhopalosiphum padi]
MFNCAICGKVYVHKRDLNRHAKTHDGSTNSCGICLKTFTRPDNLRNHVQNLHMIVKNTPEFHSAVQIGGAMGRASVINWAPPTTTPHAQPDVSPTTTTILTHDRHRAGTITLPRQAPPSTTRIPTIVTPVTRTGDSHQVRCKIPYPHRTIKTDLATVGR